MLFSLGALLSIVSLSCGVVVGLFFGFGKYWLGGGLLLLGLVASAWIGLKDQDQQTEQFQIAEDRAALVERELRESKEREAQLKTDLSELASRLDASRDKLEGVSRALEAARSRGERLEGSVSSLMVSLSDSRDREILLGEDVTRLRADNSGLRDDLAFAQRQIVKLLEKVESGNAESAVIRENVESQRRTQQQGETRRRRQEYCSTTYSSTVDPDGSTRTGRLLTVDRSIIGNGTCKCGRYYGPGEEPEAINC